ncbi:MAG: membrane protein insertase YidC, partial [Sinomicrobium sp.]|nr:membrane protein insertase YidC [Sinomicrobium sp.]
MEEKKLDLNSIIGFVLIGLILIWVIYNNQPTPEELQQAKEKQEQVEKDKQNALPAAATIQKNDSIPQDSAALARYKNDLGAFGNAVQRPSTDTIVLENELIRLKISAKGGQIAEAKMKKFVTYDSVPVYLVHENNASFGLTFGAADNKVITTETLYFEPQLSTEGENKVLSMRLNVSENRFLEYRYVLKPNDYLVDFNVRSQGLNGIIDSGRQIVMDWKLKGIRQSKSITYENRYTRLTYRHHDKKISKLSPSGNDEDTEDAVSWLSYRQHFFSSILAADTPFENVKLSSENLVDGEDKEARWTKIYAAAVPLKLQGG